MSSQGLAALRSQQSGFASKGPIAELETVHVVLFRSSERTDGGHVFPDFAALHPEILSRIDARMFVFFF